VKVLEVTMRTPVALQCIEAIAKAVPRGHGRRRHHPQRRPMPRPRWTPGSRFAVSPGYTAEVGAACRRIGLPLLPGVATASEVMAARPTAVVPEVLPGHAGRRHARC
jgi:2-dehydro-3-deoxyphosphogluconate aldolase/(4S)-4-hydroxy-2-oxoglutarate aldolase